jgi:hypothetical protein
MKLKVTIPIIVLLFGFELTFAQDQLPSMGSFGEKIDKKGAVNAKKLPKKIQNAEPVNIKIKGKVKEVCQAKGCWMTIDLGKGETMTVKFKDYGFFVPKDAAGKTAIFDGVAKMEEVGVDELQHLAEDAGKSQKEIEAITEPKEEITFLANGVIIE